ncbi:MAG: response regulator [Candidatus Thioglobus sp.]|nr:response regulator [Candidatus Thioglobus pontius]MBL6976776.1 response regulator [Candidatus Thioglobus sp.]MBL6984418.1 response regulator [Candidatus Thioglobus sp.]
MIGIFTEQNFKVVCFDAYSDYLAQVDDTQGCLIADITTTEGNGASLLNKLNVIEHLSPVVFISSLGSVATMVEVIKLGAFDFIEYPFSSAKVLEKVSHAIDDFQKNIDIIERYKQLTNKEKKVFACIVLGATNQQMTERLHASTSTIEKHRASVMKKMQADTLPSLVKMLPMLNPLSIDLEPAWCDLATV